MLRDPRDETSGVAAVCPHQHHRRHHCLRPGQRQAPAVAVTSTTTNTPSESVTTCRFLPLSRFPPSHPRVSVATVSASLTACASRHPRRRHWIPAAPVTELRPQRVGNYPYGGKVGEPGFEWLRHFEAFVPFTATITIHFPDASILNIMNAASPVSARETRMFAPIARNFDLDQPVEDVYAFTLHIFEEDRAIVEIQKPEKLPLDPRLEVNIPADRSSVAYRRALLSMGLSEFFTA